MEGDLLMSEKERGRKVEFEGIVEGRMRIREVSQKLGLSHRQCRRSFKRFREEGDAGLVHRSRGRPSNRAKAAGFRRAVVERYRERYEGFGPTFATEKLVADGYELDQETTEVAMRLLWRWIERYGIPKALYTDKKNVFVTDREPTIEEQLAGEEPMTAFGKACKKLGIEIIQAPPLSQASARGSPDAVLFSKT